MNVTTATARRNRQAGFTLIDLLFVIALIGLLSSLAVPGLMRAQGAAQATSAVGTLNVINSAELSFAIGCGSGFYAPDLPTLGIPPPGALEAFLSPELTAGFTLVKSGYLFSLAGVPLSGAPPTCNGLGANSTSAGYAVVADTLAPGAASPKFFGTNTDGLVYEHSATLSSTMPETGAPSAGQLLKQ
jgi:prepilin-type N-terminal cleavage/methylation domain-containing protein